MKKNILIVGGSGFLGKNLIISLLNSEKYNLISISRNLNRSYKSKKNLSVIRSDLTKFSNLKKIIGNKKIDVVINFGGNIDHKNKDQTEKSHYKLCKNLVDFFKKRDISLFIQSGSSMEYGDIKSPNFEKDKSNPNSCYGRSKLKASKYLEKSGINFIILRLYQIYGPFQKINRLIPLTIKNLLSNKNFNSTSGAQVRDFLYIEDLINLIKKILKKKSVQKGIYNVGSGKPVKVKIVLKNIQNLISKTKINFGKLAMRKDEPIKLYPNINKVKKEFKWSPKTSLSTGLKKTIKFYER